MTKHWWAVILLSTTALTLTGCSDFVDQDQTRTDPEARVVLEPGRPVGQTFVARHGGLDGIAVWLEPLHDGQGEIRLHLRADSQAQEDLAAAVLPMEQVTNPGFYRFSFSPIADSHSRYYYAFLDTTETELQVGAGPGNVYLDGALYQDHVPLDAQMAFQLVYDPWLLVVDLGHAVVGWMGLLAVSGLLYVVPGWALLAWLWPGNRMPWAAKLGVAVGLSLAMYPLLMLWTDLIGLHLGPLYAWLPVVGGIVALVWRHRDWRPRKGWEALQQWARSQALWPDLVLLAVLGLVFGVRLLVVRSLDAPMWGDSYQHTMIAQLLVDNGGLFDSWEPYADLQTFTYHFGFHSMIAVLHWLSRMEMLQAVLWGGQILNALAVLALYPLALRVNETRWAGVGAVLVAGLLSPMPMTYVNWGRYTQLAGQAILPAAVLLTWSALDAARRDRRISILSWIAAGGLALAHYRVLVFYVIFVLAWMLLALRRATWRRALSRTALLGVGAAVLFLPWFIQVFAGEIMRILEWRLTTAPASSASLSHQPVLLDLASYQAPAMWLTMIVAMALGLWQRQRAALIVALWWFLLLVATNPSWIGLPGSEIISNFALFIAIYVPASLMIGNLLGYFVDRAGTHRWSNALMGLLVLGLGLIGVRERMGDMRVFQHAMLVRPDVRAMTWIRENTPSRARFLINSFFAYDDSVIVGSDGGWWLPLLTERANTVPPLVQGFEQDPWSGYRSWTNELTRQIQLVGMDDPTTLAMLKEREITYIYIGQQRGHVNYGGPYVLDPNTLLHSPSFRPVYRQDRVWVFEVVG